MINRIDTIENRPETGAMAAVETWRHDADSDPDEVFAAPPLSVDPSVGPFAGAEMSPQRRFRTLQKIFLTVTLSSVMIIIFGFFAYLETSQYRRDAALIDRKLTDMLDAGSILLADATYRRDAERVLLTLAPILGDPEIQGITVRLADGSILAEHGRTIGEFDTALVRTRPIMHLVDDVPAEIGVIFIGLSHDRINAEFSTRLRHHLLLAALILAAITFSVHQSLRLSVMQPMRRLLTSIRNWQADGTHHPVTWARNDEFGQLIAAFNTMQQQQQIYHRDLRAARDNAESADRAKTAFLAIISHELRTPLNIIIGFSDLLQRSVGDGSSPDQAEYVAHIGDSGRQLLTLINDILDITHANAGELTLAEAPCDLRSMVETVSAKAVRNSDVEIAAIENRIAADMPPLHIDATRMGRAVEHLIANAVAATQADGKVTVSADCEDRDWICINIRDTGIGIPAERFAQLMQPFSTGDVNWQNHSEGAGLGLTYARVVALLHGGGFEMDSAPGAGTLISIRLPANRLRTD
jgi:signal transduction histidine kinase